MKTRLVINDIMGVLAPLSWQHSNILGDLHGKKMVEQGASVCTIKGTMYINVYLEPSSKFCDIKS